VKPSPLVDTRVIYCGDNLDKLKLLPPNCVDLIYIDPPFNSNRNYEVFWGETKEKRYFEDRHESTKAYIDFMRPRCELLARVLKKTGSFYYHCDWHASHYVKVMLDQIFGENNFQNEIVWKRTHAHGDSKRKFANISDSIFFYTASKEYTFNPVYLPYSEEYVKQYYNQINEHGRRYQLVSLRSPNPRPNLTYDYKGYKPHKNGWAVSREVMERLDAEGRLHFPSKSTGAIREKYFLDEMKGVIAGDVWTDIPPISAHAQERLGYPTQKPLTLLDRIVRASSKENDIVLDAFCGCGTALVAAQNAGRQWIGIDHSPTACNVIAKRLRQVCRLPMDEKLWRIGRGFIMRDLPWTEDQLRKIPPFEFENWAVIAIHGTPNVSHVGDMGMDGKIYPTSGLPEGSSKSDPALPFMDVWYPVQVKQSDKVGRPEIDKFEAVMMREDRTRGYFVAFSFSTDALREMNAFFQRTGREIIPFTVQQLLDEDFMSHRKPPSSITIGARETRSSRRK
jgi:DNA modification methylase